MVVVTSNCYIDLKTPRNVPPPQFDHEDVLLVCDEHACSGDETYIVYDSGSSYCKVEEIIG